MNGLAQGKTFEAMSRDLSKAIDISNSRALKIVSFQDIKDTDPDYCKKFKVSKTPSRELMWYGGKCPNVTDRDYINCLTVKQDRWNNSGLVEFEDFCRYLTTRELELAQTVSVGYTDCVSMKQAEDLLGDGWTVDVIAHILKSANFQTT